MPIMPKRPCPHPGCGVLVERGRCPAHQRTQRQQYDSRRGNSAARGYDRRWRNYRLQYLREHPLCVECSKQHRTTAATVVDHITPVNGRDDPLFWDEGNHQALCAPCHSVKTAREDGGFGNK